MAQKLISRINQRAHYSKNEDRPEVAELSQTWQALLQEHSAEECLL